MAGLVCQRNPAGAKSTLADSDRVGETSAMILFNTRLLFVHNPKTAGTSLLRFFEDCLQGQVFKAGVKELGTYHPHLCEAEAYAASVLGRTEPGFEYIVSVARNPFDRERSMYRYFREVLANSPTLKADLPDPDMLEAVQVAAELPFGDFVRWMVTQRGGCDLWRSRAFYERRPGTHPLRLTLLRCESLETDLQTYLPDDLFGSREPLPRLNTALAGEQVEISDETADAIAGSYPWLLEGGYGASEVRPDGIPAYPRQPVAPVRGSKF